jgi:hypothetical protein
MFERAHIEKLLKLNGVEATAPDEEIKSVLLSARWHKNDVETALLVLRENTTSHESHVDSLHKVFRSDDNLRPETISALLGIDAEVEKGTLQRRAMQPRVSAGQIIQIGLVSLALSLIFILASMWFLQMGFFHPTLR